MLGEARHHVAVVHAPAVDALEVGADLPAGERGRGAEVLVALGVGVVVVHAEQERVDGRPLEAERHRLQHRIVWGLDRPRSWVARRLAHGRSNCVRRPAIPRGA
jgi:hypothetical protein